MSNEMYNRKMKKMQANNKSKSDKNKNNENKKGFKK